MNVIREILKKAILENLPMDCYVAPVGVGLMTSAACHQVDQGETLAGDVLEKYVLNKIALHSTHTWLGELEDALRDEFKKAYEELRAGKGSYLYMQKALGEQAARQKQAEG